MEMSSIISVDLFYELAALQQAEDKAACLHIDSPEEMPKLFDQQLR